MTSKAQLTQSGTFWYVVTAQGRFGPLDSEEEAAEYAQLLQLAMAAGSETACTEDECLA